MEAGQGTSRLVNARQEADKVLLTFPSSLTFLPHANGSCITKRSPCAMTDGLAHSWRWGRVRGTEFHQLRPGRERMGARPRGLRVDPAHLAMTTAGGWHYHPPRVAHSFSTSHRPPAGDQPATRIPDPRLSKFAFRTRPCRSAWVVQLDASQCSGASPRICLQRQRRIKMRIRERCGCGWGNGAGVQDRPPEHSSGAGPGTLGSTPARRGHLTPSRHCG